MKTTGRKPQQPRFSGRHGGYIGDDPPRVEVIVKEPLPVSPKCARNDEPNVLAAVFERSPLGRRALELSNSIALARRDESIADETVRETSHDLDRLRRTLFGTDPLARETAAVQIRYVQDKLARWQRARAHYESQRMQLEFALRDALRAMIE